MDFQQWFRAASSTQRLMLAAKAGIKFADLAKYADGKEELPETLAHRIASAATDITPDANIDFDSLIASGVAVGMTVAPASPHPRTRRPTLSLSRNEVAVQSAHQT